MKAAKRGCGIVVKSLGLAAAFAMAAATAYAADPVQKIKSVAVFVPGAVAGSPLYEQMVSGAQRACKEAGVKFSAIEAGFNQADWGGKLSQLAASGEWDLIVSSNPAIPALCLEALKVAPKQKFFVADGYLDGNAQMATVQYNQVEQGYLLGYFAGLMSLSKSDGKNKDKKVGVIIAQRYPSLDQAILPGFEKGLKDAAPGYGIESRLIGNWYDSAKAMELSKALIDSGVSVLFPVAGGAAQGVITAAKESGKSVVWFDGSAYAQAPGTILACSLIRQEKLMYEKVSAALSGKLELGKAIVLSVKDGYVDFDDADPLYRKFVSADVRKKMQPIIDGLRSGAISFTTPTF
jgi:riboflavin transport system substrate-binding protein